MFSRRDLLRGAPLISCILFAASSLLLCLALCDLSLLTDLFSHGGRLVILEGELEEMNALVPEGVLTSGERQAPVPRAGQVVYLDRGLLPTLWHYRDSFFARPLAAAYAKFSPLQDDKQALLSLVILAALFAWSRSMLESRARMLLINAGLTLATRLRRSIHRQTLRLGPSDLEGRASGEAMQLFTIEVDRLTAGVSLWAERIGRDPLKLMLLLSLAVAVNPSLAVICLVPIAGCWYLVYRETRRIEEVRHLFQAHADRELKLLAEGLERTRLVRGFGMEAFEQELFQKYLDRFQNQILKGLRAKTWSRRAIRTLVPALLAVVLLIVGWNILCAAERISFAGGVLLMGAIAMAWMPLQNLMRLESEHEPAEQAAHRIQTYLNLIPEVGQAVGAKFLQPLSKMITFENVSYSTPGRRQLLDGLKLKLPAGRQMALVATDPLESLAVAYLLPRFIEPLSGKILIDSEDIAWVTLESLRAEVIFVGGKDPFLTASVRENISGGNPSFSLQEVTEAAKVAHAHNFIQKLPQGYETIIGEHGEQLDPGQAFRLGLARAILRKPALLIIEEPSELLDEDTKTMLDDVYKRIAPNRTIIYLPQRLSTLKRVDEIALIHKGRLAAIAPHARLVQSSPLYRHWEYLHFNEFRHEFEAE